MPRLDDRPSLRRILGGFAAGWTGLLGTRLELAALELAQERERLLLRLALLAGGLLSLLIGLLGIGAFVVLVFWETDRLVAMFAVAAAFVVAGAVLLGIGARMGRRGTAPFEATLAEFHKDAELLRESLDRDRTGGASR